MLETGKIQSIVITTLHGYGANGKSVFTRFITSLHGSRNISNVSLKAMVDDRFALSDLENKYANIDTELTSTIISNTSLLKKITGRQPIRIERKNQRAYDTLIHAKLFFSGNKIPVSVDDTDGFHRRYVIIAFPNKFEGKGDDIHLLDKLTAETSGVFNILMPILRRILDQGQISMKEDTIEKRRQRYTITANPLEAFLEEVIAEDSILSDYVTKENMNQACIRFCSKHNLAIVSKDNLGKFLKKKLQEGRETTGRRETIWKGVRLKAEYNISSKQETLNLAPESWNNKPVN
jgi:P4 family phage/plasmid primase-like protien